MSAMSITLANELSAPSKYQWFVESKRPVFQIAVLLLPYINPAPADVLVRETPKAAWSFEALLGLKIEKLADNGLVKSTAVVGATRLIVHAEVLSFKSQVVPLTAQNSYPPNPTPSREVIN